jgi:replicative DNA helicase
MEGGELILLAARPRMGKTQLALNIAKKNAVAGNAVGIFSLEMMGKTLAGRMVANEIGISPKRFRKGDLSDREYIKLGDAITKIYDLPIYIEQLMGLDVFQIAARARMLKNTQDIKLLIVDYIQLIRSHNHYLKKHELIGEIDSVLIEFAKDANVPVLCLAQLNREVEKGKYRFPMLSDLSESGKLEQDAHIIMFIERPELSQHFENKLTVPMRQGKDTRDYDKENLAIIEIAKFREEGGSHSDRIPLYFNPALQDYVSVDNYHNESSEPEFYESPF